MLTGVAAMMQERRERYRERVAGEWAHSRRKLQTGMASRELDGTLVLQPGIQSGRLVMPGPIYIFQEHRAKST